jgi:hypothetical protein
VYLQNPGQFFYPTAPIYRKKTEQHAGNHNRRDKIDCFHGTQVIKSRQVGTFRLPVGSGYFFALDWLRSFWSFFFADFVIFHTRIIYIFLAVV